MKAAIDSIIIKERIRKEITRIPELAADIEKNGLLHPVTVMALDGGYRLLAGLRRIRATQSLGWAEIDVKVVAPADAEAALNIEISENEQREEFTFSEKMDYGQLIEEIEKEKAKERMLSGKKCDDPVDRGPQGTAREKGGFEEDAGRGTNLEQGKSRDAIGAKIGMSGKQYDRAKYIADNAPPEVIEQLDRGERTIRGTYDELRAKEKPAPPEPSEIGDGEPACCGDDDQQAARAANSRAEPDDTTDGDPPCRDDNQPAGHTDDSRLDTGTSPESNNTSDDSLQCDLPVKKNSKVKLLSEMVAKTNQSDRYITRLEAEAAEAARKREAFDSLMPEGKIEELQRQIREWRASDATLQSDLANLRQRYDITVDHKDSIIEYLKKKNDELREALGAAYERITELVVESGGIPPVFPKMGKLPVAIDAITMQPIPPLDEDGQ